MSGLLIAARETNVSGKHKSIELAVDIAGLSGSPYVSRNFGKANYLNFIAKEEASEGGRRVTNGAVVNGKCVCLVCVPRTSRWHGNLEAALRLVVVRFACALLTRTWRVD